MRNTLKSSREYLELPQLSLEEGKRVKEIYRKLAKLLHPDVNQGLSGEMMELWIQVKEAYENNDLISLIILEGIVSMNDFKDDIKVNAIEETIKVVRKKINELQASIKKEETSFPLNIRAFIEDDKYIEEKKQELTKDIKSYEERSIELERHISELLRGEVNE